MTKFHYTALHSDNVNAWYKRKSCHQILYGIGLLAICAWTVSPFLVYGYLTATSKATGRVYGEAGQLVFECGSDVREARAAGCEFDPVSFAWLPERCLDRELSAELAKTNWTLHADRAGTVPKSDMAFAANDSTTYITNANHVMHCVFAWKRLHRMILAGKSYHSGLSYGHTLHCSKIILEAIGRPPDSVENKALVSLPAC